MTRNLKFFLIAFLISLPFWWGTNIFQKNLENFFYAQISQPFQQILEIKIYEKTKKPDIEIQAKSAISVKIGNEGTEKILFKKEIDQPLPIASLTKLMTAVVVLENPEDYDLSKIITVSPEAVNQRENFGNLKIGDQLSIKDLLHIMLIESSNDAAYALAEVIGVDNFTEKMNQKAESLGFKNSYFVNPTGLDPENSSDFKNVSTARELAELGKYILNQHPQIWEISSKQIYEVFDSSGQFHHLAVNKNEFLSLVFDKIIGGKTGYTNEAGGCMILVLNGQKDGYYINVILGTSTIKARFEEMQKLINWLNE